MGRQPFRRRKADNSIDDGTGGGGVQNWWEYDSKDGFLLVNDNKYAIQSQAPFAIQGGMTTETLTTIYNPRLHAFMSPMTGDISKMSIYVQTTTSSGSCDLHVGIYESEDGYLSDLIGVAVFPNSIKSSTGAKEQTSFQESSSSTTSKTISLTKSKQYFYSFLIVSSSNDTDDIGDGIKVRAKNDNNCAVTSGRNSSVGNDGRTSYFTHTWGGLATTEAGWVWVQIANGKRPYLMLEF